MGDPRKTRKKYKGPAHPWQKARIDEERGIKRNYGLKNKKEIWKFVSEIRRIKSQAKTLIREKSKNNKQAFIEEKQLIDRLVKYGLLTEGSTLESLLGLKTSDLLGRRLQTLVHNKGFALTPKQARQFIVHGHILVNGKKITVPSYLVSLEEEHKIEFNPNSNLNDKDHPERSKEKKMKGKGSKEKPEEAKEAEVLEKIQKELVVEVTE